MRTCDIKKCPAVGLYQARKYVFCEKHKEWAHRIMKSDKYVLQRPS